MSPVLAESLRLAGHDRSCADDVLAGDAAVAGHDELDIGDVLEPAEIELARMPDVDNFDSRMKAMKPRVSFQVPNTLTGEGNLNVELTFESMEDFSPAAVAQRVDALSKLLEARSQLANLITYMDGKTGAEELVSKVLADPALLATLAATKKEPTS